MRVGRRREAQKRWGRPQLLCGAPAVSEQTVFGTYSRGRRSLDVAILLRVCTYAGNGTDEHNIDKFGVGDIQDESEGEAYYKLESAGGLGQ